jgi:predicted PurR-regulated permease PerM
MSHTDSTARWFFLGLSAIVVFLFWKIVEPFAIVLLTAAIGAVVLAPLEMWLRKRIKRPAISSFLVVFLVFLLIVGPLTAAAILMTEQALDIIRATVANPDWVANFKLEQLPVIQALPQILRDYVLSIDIPSLLKSIAEWASKNAVEVVSGGASLVFKTGIFFICLFFFLFEREKIIAELISLSPFKGSVDRNIFTRLVETVRGVVFGSIIVSIIQGIVAAIGFTIFGVPGALLWAALVVVASQVPVLGTSTITVPCVIYLLITGHIPAAIGMALWAAFAVGLIDNLVSPFIVGGRTKMHALLILLSILGGIQYFGPIGFIIGPTILAAFLVVLELYKAGILERKDVA